ncbi:hypothetical protein DAPPUDRAFT_315611 [Daphnia pulex]|uniref:Uncharacterized protein n=1 Tax=Daphnia pulex TaxID=6669 RepID=E9GA90_DAPPU|nr:hypothetical protein DAPPUDRAFT_315611 [Daphnia pulex]|eukprot:EFX83702.1 hypothetical protein DAPPUDRAFT_315611 [Daphnia pulex]
MSQRMTFVRLFALLYVVFCLAISKVTNFPLMADDEGHELLSNGTEINWQEEVESLLASLALATKE